MSTPKLPKGLPPLPPVPEGYDCIRLCGWGGLVRKENGVPWGAALIGETEASNWNLGPMGDATGNPRAFYIEAVRDPKPARTESKVSKRAEALKEKATGVSKPAPTKRKGRVVARVAESGGKRYLVFPADPESVEAMVEQAARSLAKREFWHEWRAFEGRARAALAAIGIRAPKKGGAK